jgi:hypothetical protein
MIIKPVRDQSISNAGQGIIQLVSDSGESMRELVMLLILA